MSEVAAPARAARRCHVCGNPGHYAKTCPERPGAAPPTEVPAVDPADPTPGSGPADPEPSLPPQPAPHRRGREKAAALTDAELEAFRAEWEAFVAASSLTRLHVIQYKVGVSVGRALAFLLGGHFPPDVVATFRASRRSLEGVVADHRRSHPWEHTLREGKGTGDAYVPDATPAFRWRHTWTHCETGDRIVATVPVPPSGDAFEDDHGLVALRFLPAEGAAAGRARAWPSARVELVTSSSSGTGEACPDGPAAEVTVVVNRTEARPVASMTYGEGMF